jgi:hypothetical protein
MIKDIEPSKLHKCSSICSDERHTFYIFFFEFSKILLRESMYKKYTETPKKNYKSKGEGEDYETAPKNNLS